MPLTPTNSIVKEAVNVKRSCHNSIDGDFSATDLDLDLSVNSNLNHKSSSTSFNFDYDKEQEEIAKEDGHLIRYLKVIILSILTLLAVAISLIVFHNVRGEEKEAFETNFYDGARRIADTLEQNMGLQIRAMDSLGIHVTSWAAGSNSTWPFVTVPDFDLRGASARGFAKSLSVVLLPIVADDVTRILYEEYTQKNLDWVQPAGERQVEDGEARFLAEKDQLEPATEPAVHPVLAEKGELESAEPAVSPVIFRRGVDWIVPETSPGPFFPAWTMSPVVSGLVNFNLASEQGLAEGIFASQYTQQVVIGKVTNFSNPHEADIMDAILHYTPGAQNYTLDEDPMSNIYFPIFDSYSEGSNLVGLFASTILWASLFEDSLSPGDDGFIAFLENACGQQFSFRIDGPEVEYLGDEDLHDKSYDGYLYEYPFENLLEAADGFTAPGSLLKLNGNYCPYNLRIYPSGSLEDSFYTSKPIWYAFAIIFIFLLTAVVFGFYDLVMERRAERMLQTAVEARALVASLFPKQIQGRLFEQQRRVTGRMKNMQSFGSTNRIDSVGLTTGSPSGSHADAEDGEGGPQQMLKRPGLVSQSTLRLKTYLNDSAGSQQVNKISRPMADLFPNTTVLFGDVCGFTSWCSQRDPEQVFCLLEAIYKAFDKLARRRGVFKVETIGDCYMAVTGLPDQQENHAWRMAKFALDCRTRMSEALSELEITLGPDTSDLCMRFGLNSGPVTAGVLRGEKSRFQLFGDTVNTASRMESTGEPNRIQISQSTADLLAEQGKDGWIRPRENLVEAKGKGLVKTYWLASRSNEEVEASDDFPVGRQVQFVMTKGGDQSISIRTGLGCDFGCDFSDSDDAEGEDSERSVTINNGHMTTLFEEPNEKVEMSKSRKVIMWQSELLVRALKLIVARRKGETVDVSKLKIELKQGSGLLDEVRECIELPDLDILAVTASVDPEQIDLSPAVITQLHDYVGIVASMYPPNAFHNFEHATHVAMSACKLLNRIVVPDCVDIAVATELHVSSHGINSDPLTQFAIVFAALIHDIDHPGIPNSQLKKEDPDLALMYKDKSIAEQKSFDIAWDLLMDSNKYLELRACIYSNETELRRFRQLVVNCVMATDLFDKEMKEFRVKRWEKVFGEETYESGDLSLGNRRATIVIEHIIQVADVAHTMQHWHVFRKWNERLFQENMHAYKDDRAQKDPSENWYESELWFFDNYVIPLANRLHDCEVFGIASNECLSYALENREEWAAKGREVVREMLEEYNEEFEKSQMSDESQNEGHDFEDSDSISFEELKD
jgi:class 3 adenylate cyclase